MCDAPIICWWTKVWGQDSWLPENSHRTYSRAPPISPDNYKRCYFDLDRSDPKPNKCIIVWNFEKTSSLREVTRGPGEGSEAFLTNVLNKCRPAPPAFSCVRTTFLTRFCSALSPFLTWMNRSRKAFVHCFSFVSVVSKEQIFSLLVHVFCSVCATAVQEEPGFVFVFFGKWMTGGRVFQFLLKSSGLN